MTADVSSQSIPLAAIEGLSDGVLTINDAWEIVSVNAVAVWILGRSREQLMRQNLWLTVPPLQATPCYSEFKAARESQASRSFELFYEPKDRWYQCNCFPGSSSLFVVLVDISNQKQEELLASSTNSQLTHALNRARGGFWGMEIRAGSQNLPERSYFSPNLKQLRGYQEMELGNRLSAWFSIVHPEDLEDLRQTMTAHFRRETSYFECEYRVATKDGAYRWLYSRGNLVDQKDTRMSRWIAVTLDVTERKEHEEKRARLASVIESSVDAIVCTTLDGRITAWNPSAEQLFGYQESEAIGLSLSNLGVPDGCQEELTSAVLDVTQGRRREPFETRRLHKSGRPIDVMLTLSPICDDSGTINGISAINTDVTERKAMETRSRETARTLATVLKGIPDVVMLLNSQKVIQLHNPAAERFLEALDCESELPDWVSRAVDYSISEGEDYWPSDLQGVQRTRISGEDVYLLCRVIRMTTDDNLVFGYVLILQDVTEFRLNDQIKTNLLTTVSHELKTPLTSIRMSLLVLLEQEIGALNENQLELTTVARDESDRLLRMLNRFLRLTRFEEGQGGLKFEELETREVLEAAVMETKHLCKSQGIVLETMIDENLPRIEADFDCLVNVLVNLLSNAVKHSPRDGSVELRAVPEEGQKSVRIVVKDSGPGIPTAEQKRIFDKFYKVPGNKKPGSGLGLSIVKEFIRAHGGAVSVRSAPQKGAEFAVRLPIDRKT